MIFSVSSGASPVTRMRLTRSGDLHLDGEVRIPKTTRWLTLNAADFVGGVQAYATNGTLYLTPNEINTIVSGHAPIHLPHGARLTAARLRCTDSSPGQDIFFQINRRPLADGSSTILGTQSTSGSPGEALITSNLNHVIDNQNHSYYARLVMYQILDGTHRAHTLQIEYEVDNLLP
jgi:hypothetical protein